MGAARHGLQSKFSGQFCIAGFSQEAAVFKANLHYYKLLYNDVKLTLQIWNLWGDRHGW
jgi:hypothetical protein